MRYYFDKVVNLKSFKNSDRAAVNRIIDFLGSSSDVGLSSELTTKITMECNNRIREIIGINNVILTMKRRFPVIDNAVLVCDLMSDGRYHIPDYDKEKDMWFIEEK